jgi:CheY-like chemotaxis protein
LRISFHRFLLIDSQSVEKQLTVAIANYMPFDPSVVTSPKYRGTAFASFCSIVLSDSGCMNRQHARLSKADCEFSLIARHLQRETLNRNANEMNAMSEELLLIDGDQEILDTFKKFLERHSYTVATAASGPEAVEHLGLRRPDLIVIEPALSEDWGARVLEKYLHTAAGVPIIGLSKLTRSSIAFPFRIYLVKPVSLTLLLESIRNGLCSSGLQTQI